jgi:hypothetical protein
MLIIVDIVEEEKKENNKNAITKIKVFLKLIPVKEAKYITRLDAKKLPVPTNLAGFKFLQSQPYCASGTGTLLSFGSIKVV